MRKRKEYSLVNNFKINLMNKRNEYFLLLLLVALKFILQYSLIDPVYELHRDEYLHLDQGKHLAWGFVSVAPFTSWISYFILKLGNGVFWVKFFPALFGALTIIVCWFAIEELKGKLFAKIIVSLALIFSVILRITMSNRLVVSNMTTLRKTDMPVQ